MKNTKVVRKVVRKMVGMAVRKLLGQIAKEILNASHMMRFISSEVK